MLNGSPCIVCSLVIGGASTVLSMNDAGAATIVVLNPFAGGNSASPYAVNSDGSAIAGQAGIPGGARAALWTSNNPSAVSGLPEGIAIELRGVSDSGVLAGTSTSPLSSSGRAFRSTSAGIHDLGSLGQESQAKAISADGSVIVGESTGPDGRFAVRWTGEGAIENLGRLSSGSWSSASSVSADGSVIAGISGFSWQTRGVRWTEHGIYDLGAMTASATAVSADGVTIVGQTAVIDGNPFGYAGAAQFGYRWTEHAGLQFLGTIPGGTNSAPFGVNADGSVVVGFANTATESHAFIWTEDTGMVSLRDYLIGRGVDINGWILEIATAISADGGTIVGQGLFNGSPRAWMVSGLNVQVIPGSGLAAIGTLGLAGVARRRRR
jgi:probable HAF family extracellular repeat protein